MSFSSLSSNSNLYFSNLIFLCNKPSMEDSMSTTNYKNNALCPSSQCEFSSEDSGWSLYIDDSITSSSIAYDSFCSEPVSSAVISDVAASAEGVHGNVDHVVSAKPIATKRKTRAAFVDHDLEDTASSPVYSSKVQKLEKLHMKVQAQDDGLSMSLPTQIGEIDYESYSKEKRITTSQTGEVVHSSFDWKQISCTELREKGLCLVPVSMLFNFR